ncbi:unnamed protein product [Lepeophtheirus salmonis]|nr:unnamed protein product [Lepeophtheirus salmonis]CAF3033589.1 unnamed protein product [Lepeophtheirus salmonis]
MDAAKQQNNGNKRKGASNRGSFYFGKALQQALRKDFGKTMSAGWAEKYSTASKTDDRNPTPVGNILYKLQKVITEDEVRHCLPSAGAGRDPHGMDGGMFRSLDIPVITKLYNKVLLLGELPPELLCGNTSFVPKKEEPTDMGDFRPITVLPHVTRVLHKVIANRLKQVPIDECQKGFREVNGCSENSLVLNSLLKLATKNNKKRRVALAFIDFSKAFDSVSHESLLKACERSGVPPLLLKYFRFVYGKEYCTYAINLSKSQNVRLKDGMVPQSICNEMALLEKAILQGASRLDISVSCTNMLCHLYPEYERNMVVKTRKRKGFIRTISDLSTSKVDVLDKASMNLLTSHIVRLYHPIHRWSNEAQALVLKIAKDSLLHKWDVTQLSVKFDNALEKKGIKEKSTIPEIAAFDTSSSNESVADAEIQSLTIKSPTVPIEPDFPDEHITDPLADVSNVTQAQEVLETNKPSLTEDIILADKSDVPQVGEDLETIKPSLTEDTLSNITHEITDSTHAIGGIINSEPTSNTDMESELALPGLKRTRIIYDSSPESKRINVTPPCDISPHIIQQPTPIFAVGNTVSSHNSLIIDSPSSIRRTRKRIPAPPSPPTSMTIDEPVHESCDEPKDLDIGEPIVDIACDELVDFDGQQIKDCNPAILKSTIQAHAPLNPINPVLKVKCTPNELLKIYDIQRCGFEEWRPEHLFEWYSSLAPSPPPTADAAPEVRTSKAPRNKNKIANNVENKNNQVNNNVNKNNHKKVQNKQREHIPSSVENRSANKGKLTYAKVTRANIDPNYLAQQVRKYIPTTLSQGIPLVQTKVLENTLAKRDDFKSLVTLDAKRIELDLQLAIVPNQKVFMDRYNINYVTRFLRSQSSISGFINHYLIVMKRMSHRKINTMYLCAGSWIGMVKDAVVGQQAYTFIRNYMSKTRYPDWAVPEKGKARRTHEYKLAFRNTQESLRKNWKRTAKGIIEGTFEPISQKCHIEDKILKEWKTVFETKSVSDNRFTPSLTQFNEFDHLQLIEPITLSELEKALPKRNAGKDTFGYTGSDILNLDNNIMFKTSKFCHIYWPNG